MCRCMCTYVQVLFIARGGRNDSPLLAPAHTTSRLAFDGPGQGATARFQRLLFRPDWDVVVRQIMDHAITLPGVNASQVALWGRSFGGYLTPRGCAGELRLRACVADGGVLDFYQVRRCFVGAEPRCGVNGGAGERAVLTLPSCGCSVCPLLVFSCRCRCRVDAYLLSAWCACGCAPRACCVISRSPSSICT